MRLTGKGEHYYEHYYTPAGLRRLFAAFDVWDYTLPVLADPEAFAGGDDMPAWVRPSCPRRPSPQRFRSFPPMSGWRSRSLRPRRGQRLRVAPRHVG